RFSVATGTLRFHPNVSAGPIPGYNSIPRERCRLAAKREILVTCQGGTICEPEGGWLFLEEVHYVERPASVFYRGNGILRSLDCEVWIAVPLAQHQLK